MNTDLMQAFDFDEVALQANRQGRITDRQKQLVHDFRESMLRATWLIGLVPCVILGSGTLIFFLAGNHELAGIGVRLTLIMAAGVSLYLLLANFTSQPLVKGEIHTAEGKAELTIGRRDNRTLYGFRLGTGQIFWITEAQWETIRHGQTYRLYYVDGLPSFILSVEML